jgi:hypothetical protein
MSRELVYVAALWDGDETLKRARLRHLVEQINGVPSHGETFKFEHCPDPICRAARIAGNVDGRQVEAFRRSHA